MQERSCSFPIGFPRGIHHLNDCICSIDNGFAVVDRIFERHGIFELNEAGGDVGQEVFGRFIG